MALHDEIIFVEVPIDDDTPNQSRFGANKGLKARVYHMTNGRSSDGRLITTNGKS
ncbi:MAG: hypothetical protein J6X55_01410 [Victivallales bacterium]|nr:hypothetical protein [Victivallales bacterium]